MADQTNGDAPAYTVKEYLHKIDAQISDGFLAVGKRFDRVESRIDSLESDRDKSFWPRKYGGILLTALLTGVVGALLGAASLR